MLALIKMNFQILPSILSADLSQLGNEVDAVMQAGADAIHFDVMDNHYVPNLSFGPVLCQALNKHNAQIPIDVHLMVKPVDNLIEAFAKAGASRISIHPDASIHLDRSLQLITNSNCKAGLVINPSVSLESVKWSMHLVDYILIMTVNPGFGGQKLIPQMLDKIRQARALYPQLDICVDGGVEPNNIRELAQCGANQFVAGSAIFSQTNYTDVIQKMRFQLNASLQNP